MSVVIETTIGDITVDLFLKERPNTCLNFLKLCKIKYYNFCLFHKVERNFIAQTGDPTATGRGGESIFSALYGSQAKYFEAELKPRMKHEKLGTLSMVNNGGNMNGSQFFLTLGENLTYLDEVHTVFGEVAEGHEVLLKINEIICDQNNRPYQDIRITHTVILHDPYDDPAGLSIPDASPEPTKEMLETDYIAPDEELDDTKGKNIEEIEERIKDSEAKARATILEMVGDIPDADVKPPENVLFVCKLNPATTSEDLKIIFSRFGQVLSCEVIKDKKSGESLQYAFVEYAEEKECENAFFTMDNVLIDDRRIHVDFSQSVAKLNWNQNKVGRGKPGRFQNFVLKSDSKKSDGYEMVFDTNDDTVLPRRKENRHQERSRDAKSYRFSKGSYTDKYSSRTRDVHVLKSKDIKKKHRKSRSPVKSSHNTKEYRSRSSRKSPSTSARSYHKSTSFSRSSDNRSNKDIYQKRSHSSDSSPERKKHTSTIKEKYLKDDYYQKSKHYHERLHPSDEAKNKSYDYASKHTTSSGNRRDYHPARPESPPPKSKQNRSASSDNDSHSKHRVSISSKHQKPSKSSKKSKKKIPSSHSSSSDSSSSDEYVSKKSSKLLHNRETVGRNYEKSSKHSLHKRASSPQFSKSKYKASPEKNRDEKKKYSKQNKQDSSSSDSDTYVKQSKLNSSNYKYSQKLNYRKRSSS